MSAIEHGEPSPSSHAASSSPGAPALRTSMPRAGTPSGRLGVGRRTPHFWRIREELPPRLRTVLVVASLVAPIVLWFMVSNLTDSLFTPTLTDIWTAGWDLAASGQLQDDAWASTRRDHSVLKTCRQWPMRVPPAQSSTAWPTLARAASMSE